MKYLNKISLLIRNRSNLNFLKDFGITFSGTSSIFFIQLATTPIISRLYDPQNYGEFAIFNLIYTNVSIFSLFGFQEALMITKNKSEFKALSTVILLGTICISVIYCLIGILADNQIIGLMSDLKATPWWFYWIAPLIIIQGLTAILTTWNAQQKKFGRNVVSNVLSRSSGRAAVILLGVIKFQSVGLVIGEVFTIISALIIRIVHDFRGKMANFHSVLFLGYKYWSRLKWIVHKYRSYPQFVFPSSYLNLVSGQIPIFYISSVFLTSELGYYTFAFSMVNIPIQLIGNALRPVYFQRSNEYLDQKKSLTQFTKKTLLMLTGFGLPFFVVLYFFGKDLFEILFGGEWGRSGQIASIVSIYLFFNFLTNPIMSVFYTLRQEKLLFHINIFKLLVRSASLGVAYFFDADLFETIWCYVIANVFLFLSQLLIIKRILKTY